MYKFKQLLLGFLLLIVSTSGFSELRGLSPTELQTLIDQGGHVIDIRTVPEWAATGTIPSSHKLMYFDENGDSDEEQWMAQLKRIVGSSEKPVVIVCQAGGRSKVVGKLLDKKKGFSKVYHLENGIRGWIKEQKETVKNAPETAN